jgi:hypothetical protein
MASKILKPKCDLFLEITSIRKTKFYCASETEKIEPS